MAYRKTAAVVPFRRTRREGLLARRGGFILLAMLVAFGIGHQAEAFISQTPGTEGTRSGTERVAANFLPCRSASNPTCVIDGDTIRLRGQKIRLADINTPEVGDPACAYEAELGARATRRLQTLLNAGPFDIRTVDRDSDRYGRKLRTLHRDGRSLGAILVEEGLAEPWQGYRHDWCA